MTVLRAAFFDAKLLDVTPAITSLLSTVYVAPDTAVNVGPKDGSSVGLEVVGDFVGKVVEGAIEGEVDGAVDGIADGAVEGI